MSAISRHTITLGDLVRGLVVLPENAESLPIRGITLDSRAVVSGGVFLALAGHRQHGMAYLQQVVEKGASAIFFDPRQGGQMLLDQWLQAHPNNATLIEPISNLHMLCGYLAERFHKEPSLQLEVVGITGTNGKTSCSHFLARALSGAVIGTLGSGRPGELVKTVNTTPNAVEIHSRLADFVGDGIKHIAMEVSSHALVQHRTDGVKFSGAVFLNLSRDHLDYHGDMDTYFEAKLQLFCRHQLDYVVVNLDDSYSELLLQRMVLPKTVVGFSRRKERFSVPTVIATHVGYLPTGLTMTLEYQKKQATIETLLMGDFNVENILATVAVLLARGETLSKAVQRLQGVSPVPGRMESVELGMASCMLPKVVVDYAHTPDALENALYSLRGHCKGKLWVVFGCGGDRDKGKRPLMGEVAAELADRVVVTADNPRSEEQSQISQDILRGIVSSAPHVQVMHDRRQAIWHAISSAENQDLVLLAGKGHETEQQIGDLCLVFDDHTVAREALYSRCEGNGGSA